MSRKQLPTPEAAKYILDDIPSRFVDDGCTKSPDSIFGFRFKWACRIHDYRYCARCHMPGMMTQRARRYADRELRQFISASVPWRWRWVKWVYWRVVRRAGGDSAWNSCEIHPEPDGLTYYQIDNDLCRHNMPRPEWMERLRVLQAGDTERLGRV